MMVFTYLSTNYYKPKNDYIQSPFKNDTFLWGGIQIQSPDKSADIDFPRDNFYLNYALGVKNTFEVPQAPIEEVEIEAVIESFLYKKAKTNNRGNFIAFATRFGPEMLESPQLFSKVMYTLDEVEYISGLTGGMQPQSVKALPQSSPLHKFFNHEFEVSPSHRLTFEECELLIPKRYILTIDNLSKTKTMDLIDFRATSPELTPYLPHSNAQFSAQSSYSQGARDFPLKLGPLSSLELHLVFLPETLGVFEAAFYILVNDVVFVGSVSATVVPNSFQLWPIYMVDVTVNERVEVPVKMFNPLSDSHLVIEELWSTDSYAQLTWPNGQPIPQTFDDQGNAEPPLEPLRNSEFMRLPPKNESELFRVVFQVNQTQDYYAEVHILTDHHDIIRVPVYFHVHSDVVKFFPPTGDFGLVPLNFDLMKINLRGRNKAQEALKILDVHVPIQDDRLDFIMLEAKNTDRTNTFLPSTEFLLGYVMLLPSSPGLILQKIIVTALGLQSNRTFKIEYLVTGKVVNDSQALQGNLDDQSKELYRNFAPPIVSFDVGEYIVSQQLSRMLFVIPSFRPVILTAPLVIKNTFPKPILIKGIVNNNKELKVTLLPGLSPDFLQQRLIIQPNETVKFAQIELLTSHLRVSQGVKYIQIEVNETQIPAAVQIYDRQLTCVWEEHQKQRFVQCSQGYDINFGYVPSNETKLKRLNVTNLNPYSITFESVAKSQQDDLLVFIDRVFERHGRKGGLANRTESELGMTLVNSRKSKRVVNVTIRPQQTFSLTFQVVAREPKHRSGKLEFHTRRKETQNFTFNYQYTVVDGNLSIVPSVIRFNSALTGQVLTKPLVARSSFDIPIVIKQITSSDPRIFAQFQSANSNIIMPRNKTEVGIVSLDVNRMGQNSVLFQSFENAMFGGQQAFDQQLPSHIVQMINSGQIAANGQITMIMNDQQIQISGGQVVTGGKSGGLNQNAQGPQRTFITVGDLLLYREKQKVWDDLGAHGKTEINAAISIETNVFANITVQVRAHLTKPCITIEDSMDFGVVQVGSESYKNIKIVNPSDQPIHVALFLSSEPLNEAQELNPTKEQSVEDKEKAKPGQKESAVLWSQYVYGFDLKPEHPIVQYCNEITDIDVIVDTNFIQQSIEAEEFLINSELGQNELCSMLRLLLNTDVISQTQKEAIVRSVETYFKTLATPLGDQLSSQHIEKTVKQNLMQINKSLIQRQSHMQIDLNQFKIEDIMRDMNENTIGGGGQSVPSHFQHASSSVNTTELDGFAGKLNKVSFNRFLDQNVLAVLKSQEQGQSSNGFWDTLRAVFKHPQSQQKIKMMRNATVAQQQQLQDVLLRQELKKQRRFRFKSEFLNDLIVNNDSSRITNDVMNFSNSKQFQISNQSFYLSPKQVGAVHKVEARSNLTINQALIFQPLSLSSQEFKMHLIIKNELTHLYQVELVGKSGTGLLQFNQVLKKHPFADSYIAMPNLNHHQSMNYFHQKGKEQDQQSQSSAKTQDNSYTATMKKILAYIYGGERETLFESKSSHTLALKQAEFERVIFFNIAAEDMIPIQQEAVQSDMQTGSPGRDYHSLLSDLLTYRFENIKLETTHRRIFVAQNIGNLPISIDSVSIEGLGCSGFGIVIENCNAFTVKPGDSYQIKISFTTDYSIGKIRKAIILESKMFSQEVVLNIQMPQSLLPLANQILPLSAREETFYLSLKLVILAVGALIVLKISQDIVMHLKFKLDAKRQQRLNYQISQDHFIKINQPLKVKELPVMKEMIGNEHIINTFQLAQEKLENPNQLLLKEITNLCSNKKSLVIMEAQKQAIDAEKERRRNNNQRTALFSNPLHQNIAANKYLENRMKEEQLQQQIQQQIQQQQQQQITMNAKGKQTSTQEAKREQDSFTKVQAGRSQGQKQKPPPESVASSNTSNQGDISPRNFKDETPKKQTDLTQSKAKQQSQEHIKSSTSPNQELPLKVPAQFNTEEHKSEEKQRTDSNADIQLQSDSLDLSQQAIDKQTLQSKGGVKAATTRMSKKQQRQTAQRIKEQQEMEERFRQAQKRKEEEAVVQQKRRDQELQRARELAQQAEEELRIFRLQEEQKAALHLELEAAGQTGTDSFNQSLVIEKDNSLNLSHIEEKVQKSKSVKEQREKEFKQNLEYIGDLSEEVVPEAQSSDLGQVQKSFDAKSSFQSSNRETIEQRIVTDTKQNRIVQSEQQTQSKVSQATKTNEKQKPIAIGSQKVVVNKESERIEKQTDKAEVRAQSQTEDGQNTQTYVRKVFIDRVAEAKLQSQLNTRGGRLQNYYNASTSQTSQGNISGAAYQGGSSKYLGSYGNTRGGHLDGRKDQGYGDQANYRNQSTRGRGRPIYQKSYDYDEEDYDREEYAYDNYQGANYYQRPGPPQYQAKRSNRDDSYFKSYSQSNQQPNQLTNVKTHPTQRFQKKMITEQKSSTEDVRESKDQISKASGSQEGQKIISQSKPILNQLQLEENKSEGSKLNSSGGDNSVQDHAFIQDDDESHNSQNDQADTSGHNQQVATQENEEGSLTSSQQEYKDSSQDSSGEEQQENADKQIRPTHSPRKSGGQLSRDELRPFFESQRKAPEEEKKGEQKKSMLGNLISPSNSISQSIFSFNPLSIFAQPIGITSQPSQPTHRGSQDSDPQSPHYEKDLSKLIEDDEDEDHQPFSGSFINSQYQSQSQSKYQSVFQSQANSQLNSQRGNRPESSLNYPHQQQTSFAYNPKGSEDAFQNQYGEESKIWGGAPPIQQQQKQGTANTDFYNTFKSASSLFAKPLFGATIQKINEAKQQQTSANNTSSSFINQYGRQEDEKHSNSLIFNTSQNLNLGEDDEKDQTLEEMDEDDDNGGSLFSGSLFGDGGLFGSSRKSFNSQIQHNNNAQVSGPGVYDTNATSIFRDTVSSLPTFVPSAKQSQAADEIFFPPPGLSLPATNPSLAQTSSFPPSSIFGGSVNPTTPPVMNINPYQQQFLQQQQQIRNVQFQPQTSGASSSLFGSTFGLGFGTGSSFNSPAPGLGAPTQSAVGGGVQNPAYQTAAQQLLQQQQQQQYQLHLLQQLQFQQLQQQLQSQSSQGLNPTQITPTQQPSLHSQLNLLGNQNQFSSIWSQQTASLHQGIQSNTKVSSFNLSQSSNPSSAKEKDNQPQSSVDDLE